MEIFGSHYPGFEEENKLYMCCIQHSAYGLPFSKINIPRFHEI